MFPSFYSSRSWILNTCFPWHFRVHIHAKFYLLPYVDGIDSFHNFSHCLVTFYKNFWECCIMIVVNVVVWENIYVDMCNVFMNSLR